MPSYEEQMAWALQQSTLDVQAEAPTEAQKAAFFAKVGGSLEQVRSATRLDWSRKGLTAGDCKVVAHLIATKLPVLSTLILWKNNIGDEGAKAIAEALKVNTVLTVLYLGENNIGDDGAKAIAEALKVNAVKTTVLLGDNNIGDEGAIAIAEVLKDIAVVC
jgi:Ran GTPase-activating protein (RanGAP) involved in mRNA processing and transport